MRSHVHATTVPPALFVGMFWGLVLTGIAALMFVTALRVVEHL